MPLEPVCDKWRAFGWHVVEVDGHSVAELVEVLDDTKKVKGKPSLIVAHTVKGKGVPFYENKVASHAVSMSPAQAKEALLSLGCSHEETENIIAKMPK